MKQNPFRRISAKNVPVRLSGLRVLMAVVVFMAALFASSGAYAKGNVTVTANNEPLGQVLKKIGSSAGVKMVFSTDETAGFKVTANVKDASVSEALDKVLSGKPFKYEQKGNFVTVSRQKDKKGKTTGALREVKGQVLDSEGSPLPGVTVKLEGTNTMTATDIDGYYSLNIGTGEETLEFYFIGMNPNQLMVQAGTGATTLPVIHMNENTKTLSEIIVTGYQEINKEKMTGAVTTVNAAKLDERYMPNVLDNLEGRVAGLSTYGGKPIIRGTGTLEGTTHPLLVVDGLPIEGSLSDINPSNIESINVLKDAASAAIYGARAANGIIVVTTKNAKRENKFEVDFSADITWYENQNVDYADNFYMSPAEQVKAESDYWEYYFFSGEKESPVETTTKEVYDGQIMSNLKYDYWRLATGEISRDELEKIKAGYSRNNYAKDLAKNMLRRQVIQQYNLALRHRTEKARNSLVVNYRYDRENRIEHHNDWLNISYKGVFDVAKWLTARVNLDGVFANAQSYGGDFSTEDIFNPFGRDAYMPYYGADGKTLTQYMNGYDNGFGRYEYQEGIQNMGVDPLQEVKDNVKRNRRSNLRGQIGLLFKILPGLTADAQFIYETSENKTSTHANANSFIMRQMKNSFAYVQDNGQIGWKIPRDGGYLSNQRQTGDYWTVRGQLNYKKTFFEKHDIEAIAGLEFRQTKLNGDKNLIMGYDEQLQTGTTNTINFGELNQMYSSDYWIIGGYPASTFFTELREGIGLVPEEFHRYGSGYFNLTYTYDSRYNVFGSFRKDYADVYGLNSKYRGKPLWSVGAGWNIHNESFMHDLTWVNFLKLRYSYGVTGNIYQGATSLMTAATGSYNRDTFENYATIQSPANPKLRWEQSRTHNIGLDYAFLDSRLRGSIDYYHKEGKDIFGNKLLDQTTGFSSINANVASIVNKGLELSVGYDWFRPAGPEDFSWSTNVTFTHNSNKVTYVENPASSAYDLITSPYAVGKPVNALWAFRFAGIDETQGSEGQSLYYTANGAKVHEGLFDNADMLEYVGHSDPSTIIGLDNQIAWRGFSLGIMMAYYGGHQMFAQPIADMFELSWFGPVKAVYRNAWTPENKTDIPAIGQWAHASTLSSEYQTSTNCVYDADFLKIRNIVFGYDLPAKWLAKTGLTGCQLRFQINNPKALWTKNKAHIDPETLGIRQPSSYVVGININI